MKFPMRMKRILKSSKIFSNIGNSQQQF